MITRAGASVISWASLARGPPIGKVPDVSMLRCISTTAPSGVPQLDNLRGKNVLMSGSTGFVGSALKGRLNELGCNVIPLTTSRNAERGAVRWNPEKENDFLSPFPIAESNIDIVVHLGGQPLTPRWTETMKKRVYESRVNGTKLLANWLEGLPEKTNSGHQRTFVVASGVGLYEVMDDTYDGPAFTETQIAQNSQRFLYKVGMDNEYASNSIRGKVRVVNPRFGVILDPKGGVLQRMLLPFKLGLGGPMGSGKQFFPWVSLNDVVESIVFTLRNQSVNGALNVVSPGAAETTQKRFASALGTALIRPAVIPIPAFVLNAGLGNAAAKELLLGSIRVAPKALLDMGFKFRDTEIESFLIDILK